MKEMLYAEWLPYCLAIGIPYEQFGNMNPRKIKPFAKAYQIQDEKRLEENNFIAYIQGLYILEAVASCLGKHTYPKEPYNLKTNEPTIAHELTEDEKREQTENLFMVLRIMQGNFERSHNAQSDDSVS